MTYYMYPLPIEVYNNEIDTAHNNWHGGHTYSSHGVGKLDLYADVGTQVLSMTDGKIIDIHTDKSNNSLFQVLVPSGTYKTYPDGTYDRSFVIRYIHLNNYKFEVGDTIKQGDVIGEVMELSSCGSHLHLDFCTYDESSGTIGGLMGCIYNPETWENEDWQSAYSIWKSQENLPGHCWEVMSQSIVYLS